MRKMLVVPMIVVALASCVTSLSNTELESFHSSLISRDTGEVITAGKSAGPGSYLLTISPTGIDGTAISVPKLEDVAVVSPNGTFEIQGRTERGFLLSAKRPLLFEILTGVPYELEISTKGRQPHKESMQFPMSLERMYLDYIITGGGFGGLNADTLNRDGARGTDAYDMVVYVGRLDVAELTGIAANESRDFYGILILANGHSHLYFGKARETAHSGRKEISIDNSGGPGNSGFPGEDGALPTEGGKGGVGGNGGTIAFFASSQSVADVFALISKGGRGGLYGPQGKNTQPSDLSRIASLFTKPEVEPVKENADGKAGKVDKQIISLEELRAVFREHAGQVVAAKILE